VSDGYRDCLPSSSDAERNVEVAVWATELKLGEVLCAERTGRLFLLLLLFDRLSSYVFDILFEFLHNFVPEFRLKELSSPSEGGRFKVRLGGLG
jgi:hypothetical protein